MVRGTPEGETSGKFLLKKKDSEPNAYLLPRTSLTVVMLLLVGGPGGKRKEKERKRKSKIRNGSKQT